MLTSSAALACSLSLLRRFAIQESSEKVLVWFLECFLHLSVQESVFPSCTTFEACSEMFCLFVEPNRHVFGLGKCF